MSDWVLKFPGNTERLRRNVVGPDFSAVTRAALDAVDILRPAWEPLSADVAVFGLTSTDVIEADLVDISSPHWLLVRAPVPAGVRIESMWKDPVIRETPSLARANIEAWLADALGQVSAPAYCEWSELRFSAGRAWAGPREWRAGEDELRLHTEAGTLVTPVERDAEGAWLSGPREPAFDQPPVAVRFLQQVGSLTLTITRNYGNWIDASPASDRLNERVTALHAAGWGSAA